MGQEWVMGQWNRIKIKKHILNFEKSKKEKNNKLLGRGEYVEVEETTLHSGTRLWTIREITM